MMECNGPMSTQYMEVLGYNLDQRRAVSTEVLLCQYSSV